MSRYQTHIFNSEGDPIRIERHDLGGAGIADFYQNLQVTAEGLDGGAYSVSYRVPSGETWREHVTGATAQDVVVMAGSRGPLAEALLISFSGLGPAAAPRVVLNLWARF
jgi:hypothetical protein